MANEVKLKRRIRIAKNIEKTTRAMQMVAASKMRRAQENATRGKPYADRILYVTRNLVGRVDKNELHPFLVKVEKVKNVALVVLSPDKGLCGALSSNLMREFLKFNESHDSQYVVVGKKLSRSIARTGQGLLAQFPMGITQPTFEMVPPLAKIISTGFLGREFGEVYILYPQFISVFNQKPVIQELLPLEIEEEINQNNAQYFFEPGAANVLNELLPHYLESRLYQLILEAYASEQVARMLAMQNATQNAHEIIDFLTVEYNKARQEKITNEIIDIARGVSYEKQ